MKSYLWEYDSTHDIGKHTYHLWKQPHPEGFIAYTLTHQPTNGIGKDYVKPMKGTGYYCGEQALFNKTGIKL